MMNYACDNIMSIANNLDSFPKKMTFPNKYPCTPHKADTLFFHFVLNMTVY